MNGQQQTWVNVRVNGDGALSRRGFLGTIFSAGALVLGSKLFEREAFAIFLAGILGVL